MKEIEIKTALGKEDVIDLIGRQWMLVTARHFKYAAPNLAEILISPKRQGWSL